MGCIENRQVDLISVLFPCSRVDEFFEKALLSILNQTYKNFELIIIANGVGDDELTTIKGYGNLDARIKILDTKIKGLVFALNLGIHYSNGDYIARMDSDDVCDCNKLEKQIVFLKNNQDYSVVGCKVKFIDEFGNVLADEFPFFEQDIDIKRVLPIRNVLCHAALMFKKDILIKVSAYKYGFMSEDHEMFLRMQDYGVRFFNIDECLYHYRRHSQQVTDFKFAWKNFYEISAFLFMHAFRDKRYKCILGIVAVFPLTRAIFKKTKSIKNKFQCTK